MWHPEKFLFSSSLQLVHLNIRLSEVRRLRKGHGKQAVGTQHQTQPGSSPVMHSPSMDIFQKMAAELDTEGRYLFLNALANQLRYPNSHTHYFSCVLLYLFAEAKQVRLLSDLPCRISCHAASFNDSAARCAGDNSGADHEGALRALDCQSPASLGAAHHIH